MKCNNRTHPATIISYGLYLYFSSSSLRLAAKCLESVIRKSHVAIWMEVGSEIFILIVLVDRFVTDRLLVREIFVDETLLKIDGQDYWL